MGYYKLARSANEAWFDLLTTVYSKGSRVSPRGLPCREILGHQTNIDMTQPVLTIAKRKLGYRFMLGEAWWILSGKNDVRSIVAYSNKIAEFSNDGYRFDGAYGVKIVDQLRYVCDSLVSDPDSRQAVINIWRENPRPSRDVPCTISCQFMLRKEAGVEKLHCIDTMRSSDIWLGIPYDWFNFSMLSAMVALTLRDVTGRKIQLGSLLLTAGSQHLYEKNVPDAEALLVNDACLEYAPLNLDEFDGPMSLVDFLDKKKDKLEVGQQFLKEIL